jgi:hypothetical protein
MFIQSLYTYCTQYVFKTIVMPELVNRNEIMSPHGSLESTFDSRFQVLIKIRCAETYTKA